MGCAMPFADDLPFEEKVKCLADEELIEIWAESQQIEMMLNMEAPNSNMVMPDIEKAIIDELSARANRNMAQKNTRP